MTDLEQRALKVHQRLVERYGKPTWRKDLSPIAELVSTILSQNTNDTNRDRAYERLSERFPTWEQVRDADVEEIVEAIRVAGLANQKGPRIKNALEQITELRGELTLEFLKDCSPEEAFEWLVQFKGVGPKTASIVMLFALDMPAFPVDTHVHRVTGRLGIRPEKMNAEKAHDYLGDLFPEEAFYTAHLNLIRLGREICQARRPDCPKCPLQDLCDYYVEHFE